MLSVEAGFMFGDTEGNGMIRDNRVQPARNPAVREEGRGKKQYDRGAAFQVSLQLPHDSIIMLRHFGAEQRILNGARR